MLEQRANRQQGRRSPDGGAFGAHLFPDEMDRLAEHLDAPHDTSSVQITASGPHGGDAEVIRFPSGGRKWRFDQGRFLVGRGALEPPTYGS